MRIRNITIFLCVIASWTFADSAIKGMVTGPDGSPLNLVRVEASRFNGSWWQYEDSVSTDGSGNYELLGLPAGDYHVRFYDWNGDYIPEWYDNVVDEADAMTVVVGAGTVVSNINAQLAPGSKITGVVTDGSGVPLPWIFVESYRFNGSWWERWTSGNTDESGVYSVGGLSGGKYRIRFQDWDGNFATEWYNDVVIENSAASIPVPPMSTVSNVNAVLGPASRITGSITGPGGMPLENVNATPYLWTGSEWQQLDSGYTDSNGIYTVDGIPAGQYIVKFQNWQGAYAPEWFSNVLNQAQATPFTLGIGATQSNINATLSLAASISGTVTGTNGITPVAGIYVVAYRWTGSFWEWGQSASTDGSGTYTLGGLPSGRYHVEFEGGNTGYMSEWYSNAPNSSGANDVDVSEGGSVSNINASLSLGAHITGTVTGPGGMPPLEGISVSVYMQDGEYWNWMGWSESDASGHYDVPGLPTGIYRVGFYSDGQYISEYFNNAADWDSAQSVAVSPLATVSNINASLELSGAIMGTVTGPGGAPPLKDILVNLYVQNGTNWTYDQTVTTASNGSYIFWGLATGTNRLQFMDSAGIYVSEWYDNATNITGAAKVVVMSGQQVTGINATLAEVPQTGISGNVTETGSGIPLAGIEVDLYQQMFFGDWYWVQIRDTATDPAGAYKFTSLTPGTYRIGFVDGSGAHISEYYDNTNVVDIATDIPVADGVMSSGIDASLDLMPATGISGTVTEFGSDTPLAGIEVHVYQEMYFGGNWVWAKVGTTTTDSTGAYMFDGLSMGYHKIRFYDQSGAFTPEFYDNAVDLDTATDIFVYTGEMTTGIDAALVAISQSPSPLIVGVNCMGGGNWEVLFTGEEGRTCALQRAFSLTNEWDDLGVSTNCTSGTNVFCFRETASNSFWRIKVLP